MNYTGSSCKDIYSNNPVTVNISGYYYINESHWTYWNMTAIAPGGKNISGDIIVSGGFITTCAGVGGGWRRVVSINISAEESLILTSVQEIIV